MRDWLLAVPGPGGFLAVAAFLLGLGAAAAAQQGASGAPRQTRHDAYAGKTVKNSHDGMGLIRARQKNAPRVGQTAPDFRLKTLDGKKTVKLSSWRGKRPVVLVFGSYT